MVSIHKRLLLWLIVGLFVISGLAGLATYKRILQEVNEMQDFELQQIAYTVENASRAFPENFRSFETQISPSTEFNVQVWRDGKTLQYSSHPEEPLPLALERGFSFVEQGELTWRTFSLTSGNRTVQAAQTIRDLQETATETVLGIFVPFLILIPALAFLAWVAVKRGLAPLGQVVEDIEKRDADSMEPLNMEGVPVEIRPLVRALNDLLHRLEKALNIQRQFVADAAHELRTPLTALSLQAQIVQQLPDGEERKSALRDLRTGISRASHLVQQLLDLARQEPGSSHAFIRVNLVEVAKEKLGDLSLLAAEKGIELELIAEGVHWVEGDKDSLKLLIGNLVDNAIRYTPEGGHVSVSFGESNGKVLISVVDDGPGIAVQDRERIFERFYRPAGQEEPGSGLGLAIVNEVAKWHHAELKYNVPDTGHGSIFSVYFIKAGPIR